MRQNRVPFGMISKVHAFPVSQGVRLVSGFGVANGGIRQRGAERGHFRSMTFGVRYP